MTEKAPKDQLEQYIDHHTLVEIYNIYGKQSFSVGYVLCCDQQGFVYEEIDQQGRKCGYDYFDLQYLKELKTGTEYLNKLACYVQYWKDSGLLGCRQIQQYQPRKSEKLFSDLLNQQYREKRIVCFTYFEREEIDTGYIIEFNGESLAIDVLNISNTRFLERVTVEISDIASMEFYSVETILLHYAEVILKEKRVGGEPIE